jgi:polyadenylate-binding protein
MNFTEIKNKPCRIMWSQRDPSLRKSGVGNIFVRNLTPSFDNKGLYDTFSVFGNILSCKIATDDKGVSKGYGYVHFETAESAQDAISKFNGTLIDEVEVQVGSFVRKQDRAGQVDWTNLYVKQFPLSWDEAAVKALFEPFGAIANVAVNRDQDNKVRGFGFVNFADHESAVKALAELNNKTIEDPTGSFELYVSRAQKKTERTREIKSRIDALNQERVSKYQGMNLYVKNISDSITDEAFREGFATFGTITSARIMKDDAKVSKGFGFICYSSPEEATRAVTEMNGKVLGNKPIVVTLHQRREQRRAHLAATYAPQGRFPQGGIGQGGPMQMPPFLGMYLPQGQGGFPGQPQPRGAIPYPGNPMGGRGGPVNGISPRNFPVQYNGRPGFYPNGSIPPQFLQQQPGVPPNVQQIPIHGGRVPDNNQGYPGPHGNQLVNRQQNIPPQNLQQGNRRGSPQNSNVNLGFAGRGGGPINIGNINNGGRPIYPQQNQIQQQPPQAARANLKFSNQARNQNGQINIPNIQQLPLAQQQQILQQQNQIAAPVKSDFSDASLALADPLTQKNMIGEQLYPLIYRHQPEQAGKITGMLLEMDNGELLNLIESPDALLSKIDEALNVLRNHKPED